MKTGSYAGTVKCSAVVTPRPIIGGFAVSCRCGAGEWFPVEWQARAAHALHVDPSSASDEAF